MKKLLVIAIPLILAPSGNLMAQEVLALENATVQPAGIRQGDNGLMFFNIQGEGGGDFASYGVVRFDVSEEKDRLDRVFGADGWSVDTVDLFLTQANAFFTSDGGVEIFFTGDDDEDISQTTGLISYPIDDEFSDLESILAYDFVQINDGELEQYTLFDASGLNSAGGTALMNDILTDNIVTLVLMETDPSVAATYAGFTSLGFSGPFLEIVGSQAATVALQAGDADEDLDFDQFDLIQVQVAAKYLTGQATTWGEGDWNGAPGGSVGNPPAGDGLFNQFDIIAAQQASTYLTGPYAALASGGAQDDEQTSISYNPTTGELGVNAPVSTELTSINIDSAGGIFTGDPAQNLGGSFDNDADNNIFKATFGSSFGSLSFGNVAQTGLSEEFVRNDLTAVGSLAGGGDLGAVDLIYVPEPSTLALLALSLLGLMARAWLLVPQITIDGP